MSRNVKISIAWLIFVITAFIFRFIQIHGFFDFVTGTIFVIGMSGAVLITLLALVVMIEEWPKKESQDD